MQMLCTYHLVAFFSDLELYVSYMAANLHCGLFLISHLVYTSIRESGTQ